jgi:hypothetical protein
LRGHGEFLAGVSLLAASSPVEIPTHGSAAVDRESRYSFKTVVVAGMQMLRLLTHHPLGLFRDAGHNR